ncbi:MAG TPA: ABC transporter permease [Candidatus Eisenbacteria bacterium]|nr:ABC transporter permease [Candidatus Eisenbacteria bacterium]
MTKLNWTGWTVLAVLALAWECAARFYPPVQVYVPPLTQVFTSLLRIAAGGEIGGHLLTTVSRFATGYLIASLLAVTAGVVLGYFPFAYSLAHVLIEFLRPMPSVAIIPVAILLLGLTDAMIVAVTVYASVWPALVNTIDGVRNIDPVLVQTGRTFGLGWARVLWKVVLPAASPQIVTGLRISLAIALILVTTAEMLAASKGLGFFVLDEERSLRNDRMYAGIVLVALLGYVLNRVFVAAADKALRWRRGVAARQGF